MKNKILVIEDDRAISELLCMNLTIAGYETVAAYDGIEAQRLLLWNEDAYGVQQEQISVYADPERLAAYGIGEKTLSAALVAQGLTPLGGSVSNAETESSASCWS